MYLCPEPKTGRPDSLLLSALNDAARFMAPMYSPP